MYALLEGLSYTVVFVLVSEPDPRKNRKEGLGDRLGRKCTLRPECRRASDCMPMRARLLEIETANR